MFINKGISKTILYNNDKNYNNEIIWDTNYDGEKANISLEIEENGLKDQIKMSLNNKELAEILNIPSINATIDKRLKNDFLSDKSITEDKIIELYPISKTNKKVHFDENQLKDSLELLTKNIHSIPENKYTHISSPLPNEELLFPLPVSRKTQGKKPKTHITYKIHKRTKSTPNSKSHRKTLRNKYKSNHRHSYSRRTF